MNVLGSAGLNVAEMSTWIVEAKKGSVAAQTRLTQAPQATFAKTAEGETLSSVRLEEQNSWGDLGQSPPREPHGQRGTIGSATTS